MAFKIGERYDGVVVSAGLSESKEKHAPIIWFKVKAEGAGTIDHNKVVTPKTVPFIAKMMLECFGITQAQLAGEGFMDGLNEKVAGSEVSITIKGEDQKEGPPKAVVEWMNPRGFRRVVASAPVKANVSALFGGKAAAGSGGGTGADDWGITDKDVPF